MEDDQDDLDTFEIHDECWEAWLIFMACQTQWNRSGLESVPTGLNYPGVKAVMEIYDAQTTETFSLIQAAERGYLAARGGADLNDVT